MKNFIIPNMKDQTLINRLLTLLQLLGSNRHYSFSELAERCNVTERTIYRYIEKFESAGFVVRHTPDNQIYIETQKGTGKDIANLLYFSEEEAYMIQKALHGIDDNYVLKSQLMKKIYAVYDFNRVTGALFHPKQAEIIQNLYEAIKLKKQVILNGYKSANSDLMSDRLVEPFDFSINWITVWAFDLSDGVCKQFKTARIDSVTVTAHPYSFQDKHLKLETDVFRISGIADKEIELKLKLRAWSLLTEEYPMAVQFLTEINTNTALFKTKVCSFEGVGRFVLGLPGEIEVLGNRDFLDFLKKKTTFFSFDMN